jgi:hypothetical protein
MFNTTGLTPSAITQDASNVVITGRNVGINCTPLTKFHVKVTTDENFKIQGHDALTDGVALVSGNDVANAYKSMEFAASQFDFVNGEVGINCTPTTTLDDFGSFSAKIVVLTGAYSASPYVLTATDTTVIFTNADSGSTQYITLPNAATYPRRIINLMTVSVAGSSTIPAKLNSDANNVILKTGNSAQAVIIFNAVNTDTWATLQSDGTNWRIIRNG